MCGRRGSGFRAQFWITAQAPATRSFPRSRQDGGSGAEEEADLPKVHLPRRGPGPAAGHVLVRDPGLPPQACEQLMQLYSARQRRRLNRGLRRKQHSLLKRLRKAKKEAPPMEKPEVVKTHLRDMIILPEMVGSMVGVYNGKTFNQPEMIGHYLGEFSITYKPVKHGRPGIGATHSSRFIPLK
ncbi:40S ribosomal protein S15 isoform X2 [Nannospalax galili]|uniref:40S ribosomal protein S15 isoform X2 n=1 Tax=Nannospalax galili TaxID=1026970 RepID=UPI00111BF5EC|nr:40S ribosomal protein S15 isoform X2 [Nannospalax galili]